MLRYTHIYELLYRIVGIFVTVWFVGSVFDLLGLGVLRSTSGLALIVTAAIFLCCCVGVIYFLRRTIGWLPAFLYIRLTLSTKVSPSEANNLSFLFDGSLNDGKWYPLREVREISPEDRREALFQFARKITTERAK